MADKLVRCARCREYTSSTFRGYELCPELVCQCPKEPRPEELDLERRVALLERRVDELVYGAGGFVPCSKE